VPSTLRLLALLGLATLGLRADAAPAHRYRSETVRRGPGESIFRVFETATGKPIWKRGVKSIRGVYWSPDRRAVAVLDDRLSGAWYYRLILWQEGERVRTLDTFPPLRGADVNMWIAWSPDSQRFLLHESSIQGEAQTGRGSLWCVHPVTMRFHLVRRWDVTRATWIGTRRLRYWTGELSTVNNTLQVVEREHLSGCGL
jgi:hypothetical protein